MLPGEVSLAAKWAAGEGWNPGLYDAEIFGAVDPGGFFIAEDDGEPVGCVSCVRYSDAFAFLGFYIVVPQRRGEGIGLALWRAAMQHGARCNVGLDGVPAQIANYERSGFHRDYANIRYRTTGGGPPSGATETIAPEYVDEIVDYDHACFPAPRDAFVRAWVAQPGATARCVREGGRMRGYGVLRRCGDGWKIGPLFADSDRVAHDLFADLRAAAAPGDNVYLDVPAVHRGAMGLAPRENMEAVFETARMYTAGRPPFHLDATYGVTTFELG
jgi:GNAT superfamily N-acetyltransferase